MPSEDAAALTHPSPAKAFLRSRQLLVAVSPDGLYARLYRMAYQDRRGGDGRSPLGEPVPGDLPMSQGNICSFVGIFPI